jgi:hypothetical protein
MRELNNKHQHVRLVSVAKPTKKYTARFTMRALQKNDAIHKMQHDKLQTMHYCYAGYTYMLAPRITTHVQLGRKMQQQRQLTGK